MFWVGGILIRLCSLIAVWSFVMSSSFFALSSFGTLTLFDIQYLRANTVWCSDLTCTLQGYEGVTIATSKTEAGFVQVVLTDQENGMNLGRMVHDMMFPAFVSLQMISLLSRNMWSLFTINNISSLLTFASGFVKWWPTVSLTCRFNNSFTFANETKRTLYKAYTSLNSFSRDTIKSLARMYTPFFKPLIRRKKSGNWPSEPFAKRLRTLANRHEVGEKAVNGINTLNMYICGVGLAQSQSLRFLGGPSILFRLRCAAIFDYILEARLQRFFNTILNCYTFPISVSKATSKLFFS